MWSGKLCTIVGLSAILSCITLGSAEAERIHYTVNGHKYWYNSKSKHGKELAAKRLARGGGAGTPNRSRPETEPVESTHGTPAAKRLARAKRGLAETPSRSRLERQTAEESTPAPTVVEVRSVEPQNLPFSIAPPAAGGQHAVRSVTYDYESGRKRTIMADGSVFDEPFDPKAFLNAEVPPDAPT